MMVKDVKIILNYFEIKIYLDPILQLVYMYLLQSDCSTICTPSTLQWCKIESKVKIILKKVICVILNKNNKNDNAIKHL